MIMFYWLYSTFLRSFLLTYCYTCKIIPCLNSMDNTFFIHKLIISEYSKYSVKPQITFSCVLCLSHTIRILSAESLGYAGRTGHGLVKSRQELSSLKSLYALVSVLKGAFAMIRSPSNMNQTAGL